MIKYKLLKDLPTFKAGDMFYISQYGALIYDDGGFGVIILTGVAAMFIAFVIAIIAIIIKILNI